MQYTIRSDWWWGSAIRILQRKMKFMCLGPLCSDGGSAFVEQAVQLAVAAVKAGLADASSDARDLYQQQLIRGICYIFFVSRFDMVNHTYNGVFFRSLSTCILISCLEFHISNPVISVGLEITILGSNDFYSFRKQVWSIASWCSLHLLCHTLVHVRTMDYPLHVLSSC